MLVVEDSDEDLLLYERAAREHEVPGRSGAIGCRRRRGSRVAPPSAIILDLRLQGEEAWDFLTRLRREERHGVDSRDRRVHMDDQQKGLRPRRRSAYGVKPIGRSWLLGKLESLIPIRVIVRVLTVDDEETDRFIVREMLSDPMYEIAEARLGTRRARGSRTNCRLMSYCWTCG